MGMREAYQEKMEAQLKEWGAELEKLTARADKAKAEAKIEYYKQIEALRTKQETVRAKLEELKRAGDKAWEDIKAGVENAWDELKNALDSAFSKFK